MYGLIIDEYYWSTSYITIIQSMIKNVIEKIFKNLIFKILESTYLW